MRIFALLLSFILAFSAPGLAQTLPGTGAGSGNQGGGAPALPDPLTPESVRDLVSRMSDADARALLIDMMDRLAEKDPGAKAEAAADGVIADITEAASTIGGSFTEMMGKAPLVLSGLATAFQNFVATYGSATVNATLGQMLLAILLGAGAEYAVNRFTRRWHDHVDRARVPDSLREMLWILSVRLFVDLGGLIVFFAVVRVFINMFVTPSLQPLAHEFMFYLVVIPRLAWSTTKLQVSPRVPEWRLLKTDEFTARMMMRHLVGVITFMGLGTFLTSFQAANGVPPLETRFGAWVMLIAFMWFAYLVIRARAGITEMMAGWDQDITPAEKFYARIFPGIILVTLASMWLLASYLASIGRVDLLVAGSQYITVLLIGYQPLYDTVIRSIARHLVPPMRGEGPQAEKAWVAARRSYIRMGRVIVFGLVVLALANIWDISFTDMAASRVGDQFAANLIRTVAMLAIGYLVLELATTWINRQLANESIETHEPNEDADAGEGGGEAGSRLATVLPLMKLFLQAAIVIMTLLLALGQIGIDITPLLAGAGIVGLAIGFGAQTLVKDIVSGLFFLIDDAFRVGEYILVGATEGTVEKISVRSLQLRHTEGLVHTIPYGEIPQVTNASRDWVIVKMKFTVPFDTDMRKVKKIFKTIGADLLKEPYAGDILQTFKLQGVGDVNDVGLIIRGKFTAKPGRQWVARKDIYSRIQRMFEENGIEFARREVRVNIGGAVIDDATRRQVATAAAEAVQADVDAAQKVP
jgi:moderate conductance mechanosensitive channel